jgi:hypothetical protein
MAEWWIDIQNVKNRKCVEPLYTLWIGRRVNGQLSRTPGTDHIRRHDAILKPRADLKSLGKPQLSSSLQFFRFQTLINKMLTPILKRQVLQCSKHARYFSSSPIVGAKEVKRLGVIGAGQMVFL